VYVTPEAGELNLVVRAASRLAVVHIRIEVVGEQLVTAAAQKRCYRRVRVEVVSSYSHEVAQRRGNERCV